MERVTGRFYTPDLLSAGLATRVAAELAGSTGVGLTASKSIRIGDPFVGDGQLVLALLRALACHPCISTKRVVVDIRDTDSVALARAQERIRALALDLRLNVTIEATVGDSLGRSSLPPHDAVITNPPWELLKPDARETSALGVRERARYERWLRTRCDELDSRFPESRADKSWAGWGTNLARCGLALCLRSCRAGGALGIVLPATLMGDQASVTMRRTLVEKAALIDLAVYPSEARLFDKVDQPVVAACLRVGAHGGVVGAVRHFAKDASVRAQHAIDWSERGLSSTDYALPVAHGSEGAAALTKALAGLPCLATLEEAGLIWAGRELDETRVAEKLLSDGPFPFVKGRMVSRHQLVEQPWASVKPELAARIRSVAHPRLVWRDVARASSKRRMIGAMIPSGWVAGNSLHVAHVTDGDEERLLALYAVMMSMAFEAQVRMRLSTGHMSLGVIRLARVPELGKRMRQRLARAAKAALTGETGADARLEVEAARAYGFCRKDMGLLLGSFPKLTQPDVEAVLLPALWASR
ncbi:hypothetical protein AAFN86_28815 [Roseomonas sp. CAU 1739]|uniref:hypothetical protein n=1 Tax=Roseomonas sp. CAU 1739 TaxID=3140364 RepID=UPI00325A532D